MPGKGNMPGISVLTGFKFLACESIHGISKLKEKNLDGLLPWADRGRQIAPGMGPAFEGQTISFHYQGLTYSRRSTSTNDFSLARA